MRIKSLFRKKKRKDASSESPHQQIVADRGLRSNVPMQSIAAASPSTAIQRTKSNSHLLDMQAMRRDTAYRDQYIEPLSAQVIGHESYTDMLDRNYASSDGRSERSLGSMHSVAYPGSASNSFKAQQPHSRHQSITPNMQTNMQSASPDSAQSGRGAC